MRSVPVWSEWVVLGGVVLGGGGGCDEGNTRVREGCDGGGCDGGNKTRVRVRLPG